MNERKPELRGELGGTRHQRPPKKEPGRPGRKQSFAGEALERVTLFLPMAAARELKKRAVDAGQTLGQTVTELLGGTIT